MKLKKRKISGREKNEASIRLLGQLRESLHSEDVSDARRAAFNLSWMQEDGLDILKEALFSGARRRTKSAAAYGLRSMHGRMKKMALEILEQGLGHANRNISEVCRNALSLVSGKAQEKFPSKKPARRARFRIREIPTRGRQRSRIYGTRERRTPPAGR